MSTLQPKVVATREAQLERAIAAVAEARKTCAGCGRSVSLLDRRSIFQPSVVDGETWCRPCRMELAQEAVALPVGPEQSDVDALRELLDMMVNFVDNDQRARYLLSSDWMRDKLAGPPACCVTADVLAELHDLEANLPDRIRQAALKGSQAGARPIDLGDRS